MAEPRFDSPKPELIPDPFARKTVRRDSEDAIRLDNRRSFSNHGFGLETRLPFLHKIKNEEASFQFRMRDRQRKAVLSAERRVDEGVIFDALKRRDFIPSRHDA